MADVQDLVLTPPEPRDLGPDFSTRAGIAQWAIEKNATAEQLALMLDTQLRWEANEARKAFIDALQLFRTHPPEIQKTKTVTYPNKDGSQTKYKHAELDKIAVIIGKALLKVGITHSWRTDEHEGRVVVTCVFRHTLGHCEDMAKLAGPADTSGGKNSIQAIGSTTYYLERYTLLAACGLAPQNCDTDGVSNVDPKWLEEQLAELQRCETLEGLKAAFTAAAKVAIDEAKDLAAYHELKEAKNKRQKELNGGK